MPPEANRRQPTKILVIHVLFIGLVSRIQLSQSEAVNNLRLALASSADVFMLDNVQSHCKLNLVNIIS